MDPMSIVAQTPAELSALIKQLARAAGFDRCGIASAEPLGRGDFLRDWLAAGHAGSMDYLARNTEQRNDPALLLDGARSVICLAADYRDAGPDDTQPVPPAHGYVARYARGRDYHKVLRKRAWRLVDTLREELGDAKFDARVCVDTAPLLERELARRAGLGWVGKNTMVIDPSGGSYFFLAEVITTLEIAADAPIEDHCGRCRRCLDACPTAAFPEPGVMDASRCISYLTIERKDDIPDELANAVGPHLFGCDICQAVCPFNERFAAVADDPELVGPEAAERGHVDLQPVLDWDREQWLDALRGRAAKRAKPGKWQSNARVALANNPPK